MADCNDPLKEGICDAQFANTVALCSECRCVVMHTTKGSKMHISSEDLLDGETGRFFLKFIETCAKGCADADDFRGIVRRYVSKLVPHRFSIAVLGSLSFDQLSIQHMVGTDYPEAHLAAIPIQVNIRDRPVIAHWLATRTPIVVDPIRDRKLLSTLELREIETFSLGRLAIHGQIDLSSHMASYFSFAGVPEAEDEGRLKLMLSLVTPHLHAALTSMPTASMDDPALASITSLERDLLIWLAAGRSNSEIAKLRQRSPATVRNQLTALFRKMGVKTRAEAVAIVTKQNLLVKRTPNRTNDPL
jgi:DNA-binding CsgD family transcriptional regulator